MKMLLVLLKIQKTLNSKTLTIFLLSLFISFNALHASTKANDHCTINLDDFKSEKDLHSEKKTLSKAEKRKIRKRAKLSGNKWSKY
jgi:hypothetical protein